jgi:hypothetical protein
MCKHKSIIIEIIKAAVITLGATSNGPSAAILVCVPMRQVTIHNHFRQKSGNSKANSILFAD